MHEPLISVVIPAYNQSHFLAGAISSALDAGEANVEVIVVDDGSTDSTPSVVASFGNEVVYLRQDNQGLSAARNRGIRAAHGQFVQLLDSDDTLSPTSLASLAKAVAERPDAGVFAASWNEMDLSGRVFGHVQARPFAIDTFHELFDPFVLGPPCRYLVRRSAFTKAGLFDQELRACEDWDMWFNMAASGIVFVAVPGACSNYRNYPSSMSKDHNLMWRSGMRVLQRSRTGHLHCERCRRARTRGIVLWREWCYMSMLQPELSRYRLSRQFDRMGAAALRALRRDPRLAPSFARALLPKRLGDAPSGQAGPRAGDDGRS